MVRHPEFPWYGLPGQNQMRYMLKNVAAICEAAGSSLDNVVRRACFHEPVSLGLNEFDGGRGDAFGWLCGLRR